MKPARHLGSCKSTEFNIIGLRHTKLFYTKYPKRLVYFKHCLLNTLNFPKQGRLAIYRIGYKKRVPAGIDMSTAMPIILQHSSHQPIVVLHFTTLQTALLFHPKSTNSANMKRAENLNTAVAIMAASCGRMDNTFDPIQYSGSWNIKLRLNSFVEKVF